MFFCLRFWEQADYKSSNELFAPIRYTIPCASGDLRKVRRRPWALPLGVPLNRAQRHPDAAGSNPAPTEGSGSSKAERRTEVAGSNPAPAERPGSSMAECTAKEHEGWNDGIRRFAGSAEVFCRTPLKPSRGIRDPVPDLPRPRPPRWGQLRPGTSRTERSPTGTGRRRRISSFLRRLNQKLRPCRTFKEAKR